MDKINPKSSGLAFLPRKTVFMYVPLMFVYHFLYWSMKFSVFRIL